MTAQPHQAARQRAYRRLAAAHADEFQRLYDDERVSAGLPPAGQAPPKPITHGTNAGYAAHLRRYESACPECVEAHRAYQRSRR